MAAQVIGLAVTDDLVREVEVAVQRVNGLRDGRHADSDSRDLWVALLASLKTEGGVWLRVVGARRAQPTNPSLYAYSPGKQAGKMHGEVGRV